MQDTAGRWYSLRVRPYVTLDNKVDGAVLVLWTDSDSRADADKLLQTFARDNLPALGSLLARTRDAR